VAQRAARQWQIVDADDLHACGLSDRAISGRVQSGRLFPFHRGVYSVVPNPSLEGCWLAAVKACGSGAVLSHYSAAALYGWVHWDGRAPEVTAPKPRRHPHIRTHLSETIERAFVKGIPVTPPARTVVDVSSTLPFDQLRRAVNEGLNQRRIRPVDMVTSKHRGARRLREILATAAPTRNEYEDIVLAVLKDLPTPEVNQPHAGYVPDFRWPEQRVTLEADSAQFHDHLLARADDAQRQAFLEVNGETVLRTTWREITTRPDRLVARVRAALSSANPPPPGGRRAPPDPRP
jgi:very-short-patch-repair endonuclease